MSDRPLKQRTTRAWHAIYDYVLADTQDEDAARREADEVVWAMKGYDDQLAVRRRDLRRQARRRWYARFGWALLVLAFFAALGSGGYALWWIEENDYAGLDRKNVDAAIYGALGSYYGENDNPENVTIVKREHSGMAGGEAWKATVRTGEGEAVCVWVKGEGEASREYRVEEDC